MQLTKAVALLYEVAMAELNEAKDAAAKDRWWKAIEGLRSGWPGLAHLAQSDADHYAARNQ